MRRTDFQPQHLTNNTLEQWLTKGTTGVGDNTSNMFTCNTVSMAGAPLGSYSFTAKDLEALGIDA